MEKNSLDQINNENVIMDDYHNMIWVEIFNKYIDLHNKCDIFCRIKALNVNNCREI